MYNFFVKENPKSLSGSELIKSFPQPKNLISLLKHWLGLQLSISPQPKGRLGVQIKCQLLPNARPSQILLLPQPKAPWPFWQSMSSPVAEWAGKTKKSPKILHLAHWPANPVAPWDFGGPIQPTLQPSNSRPQKHNPRGKSRFKKLVVRQRCWQLFPRWDLWSGWLAPSNPRRLGCYQFSHMFFCCYNFLGFLLGKNFQKSN